MAVLLIIICWFMVQLIILFLLNMLGFRPMCGYYCESCGIYIVIVEILLNLRYCSVCRIILVLISYVTIIIMYVYDYVYYVCH